MKATGIICELNPPHAGHKFLFDFARENSNDNALVAVMSGNFVQRGEPSVFPKHIRAAAALEAGVDLVLELPSPYSLSSAEGFAAGAVTLLQATGIVNTLAFGAECGDIKILRRAAAALELPECDDFIREGLMQGVSYARACQSALEKTLGSEAKVLEAPNNMLAIQYLRAIDGKMNVICMRREPGITASGLRRELKSGVITPENMLPAGVLPYGKPVFSESLEIAMLSRLRGLSESVFYNAPGAADGIAERAIRFCKTSGSIEELALLIKTKRHTLSRVRRYLLCLALGIPKISEKPPYIRVLGANEVGRKLLKNMSTPLPVIIKPSKGQKLGGIASLIFELEAAATDFYNLGYSTEKLRQGGAEWRLSPVILKKTGNYG